MERAAAVMVLQKELLVTWFLARQLLQPFISQLGILGESMELSTVGGDFPAIPTPAAWEGTYFRHVRLGDDGEDLFYFDFSNHRHRPSGPGGSAATALKSEEYLDSRYFDHENIFEGVIGV
jgi:hypothetical protein